MTKRQKLYVFGVRNMRLSFSFGGGLLFTSPNIDLFEGFVLKLCFVLF